MKDASVESARFEPTVFGAVRRYRIMVLAFALAGMVAAVGYTLYAGKTYQAKASVTVPVPAVAAGPGPGTVSRQPGAAPGVASRRPASGQHRRHYIAKQ